MAHQSACIQHPQRYTYGQHKYLERHAHGRYAPARLGQNLLMTSLNAAGASCSCTSPCLQSRRRDVSIIPCEAIRSLSTLLPSSRHVVCPLMFSDSFRGILAYLQQEGWQERLLRPLSYLKQMCSACTVSCNPVLSQHQGQSPSHIHLGVSYSMPLNVEIRPHHLYIYLSCPFKACLQIPSSLRT